MQLKGLYKLKDFLAGLLTSTKFFVDLVCSSPKTLLHLCNKNRMDLADFRELTYVLVEEGSVGQGSTSLIFTALSYTRETFFLCKYC